jgi:hypothetical protein
MVYNPLPPDRAAAGPAGRPRPRMQARYLAGLYTLEELGPLLRRQAAQVGMEAADVWIGLTDGGSGLEEFLRQNFNRPDLVLILDFWHPAAGLEELARLLRPGDAAAAQELARGWCRTMKHEGGAAVLEALRAQPRPRRGEARQKLAGVLRYVGNNVHRMDYPRYLAEGWEIGSGPVESACKTVVGQRLKLAGMRWGEDGTDEVCHLRALLKSGGEQWDAFWQRSIN